MRCLLAAALVAGSALLAVGPTAIPADAAGSHELIQGSGSSWSANAVNQWIADVQTSGLRVVFTANGSAQGRKDYAYRTTDFGVSELGYQGFDPNTGVVDNSNGRAYAYLPIVGGGTSFPYQVRVSGKLVRNIRLSGATLTKIFTNQITNWNDPAITADNNGRVLPSLTIIPVVHSEGSGSSAQLTKYFDALYPDIWRPFNGAPGFTEYYPRKDTMISQSGSDGVMNFVSSAAANGAIGYDEYSYALAKDYPVIKLQNAAGYYTLPTQYNVAVALTQAKINTDKASPNYLLQNLDRVYRYTDKRTYPLSSYSYMIIPTAPDDPRMTTAKRQTLADFTYYAICEGQREMGPIGYSSLPVNLVQASFDQINKLKAADAGVDITQRSVSTCHNPTFVAGQPTRNYLAEIAPQPDACDQAGAGPCTGAGSTGTAGPGASVGTPAPGGATSAPGSSTPSGTTGTPGGSTSAGATSVGARPAGGTTPTTAVPGGTTGTTGGTGGTGGTAVTGGSTGTGDGSGTEQALVAQAVEVSSYERIGVSRAVVPIAVVLLLLVIVLPPTLAVRWSRRTRP
jgi:ABC-type phosphate transport system substrate-binding protein